MVSRNRGGKPGDDDKARREDEPVDALEAEDDDEFDEDLEDDELDDEDEDDLEDLDDDEEDDEDEDGASARRGGRAAASGRAGSAVASRSRARTTRSKEKAGSQAGFLGRLVARFINFVREVVAELQKVIWPTRKELLTYTTVVVVFVAIMMSFVAALDYGFARLLFLVFGKKIQQ